MINHLKNDCEDLSWIQDSNGTEELLKSCILDDDDDGDITMKLNGFNQACIILKDTVVMLKGKAGDEWEVALVGTGPVQLKYAEEMTDTIIKYVLLDIQPKVSFKQFDFSSFQIFKGVLRRTWRRQMNLYNSFLIWLKTSRIKKKRGNVYWLIDAEDTAGVVRGLSKWDFSTT